MAAVEAITALEGGVEHPVVERVDSYCAEAIIVFLDRRILIRDCLVRALHALCPSYAISGFATTEEWLASADRHLRPDLVLLGGSDAASGAELDEQVGAIRQSAEAAPLVLVSDREDAMFILEAINIGARGVIPTSLPVEVAINAIRLVLAGGSFVPAAALVSSRDEFARPLPGAGAGAKSMFTQRQTAVIEALRLGKPNKIIAYELSMCESTVKVHVRNIMKRLKATNRTQVAYLYHSFLSNNIESQRTSIGPN
jgi:DNA-binding NarL/FixJ family response regulator